MQSPSFPNRDMWDMWDKCMPSVLILLIESCHSHKDNNDHSQNHEVKMSLNFHLQRVVKYKAIFLLQ